MKFKFLNPHDFELLIQTYEQITSSIQANKQILIDSFFLQMYSQLEEALYFECERQIVKKNASILRFEEALKKQGYQLNNELWLKLLEVAKIRNCLLHGNGRLDNDKYGEDTRTSISNLNLDANEELIELVQLKEECFKIKINRTLLVYFFNKIKEFYLIQS